jgi:hypothetical protein
MQSKRCRGHEHRIEESVGLITEDIMGLIVDFQGEGRRRLNGYI